LDSSPNLHYTKEMLKAATPGEYLYNM